MSAPVASIGLTWEVPLGALAPVSGYISGRAPYISTLDLGNRFDDTVGFGSSVRSASVACTTQSITDLRCNAGGNFAVGTRFNYMHVKAITPGLMDVLSLLGCTSRH